MAIVVWAMLLLGQNREHSESIVETIARDSLNTLALHVLILSQVPSSERTYGEREMTKEFVLWKVKGHGFGYLFNLYSSFLELQ